MFFTIYFRKIDTNKIESREAVRVDSQQGVVWLKDGGWLRLEDAYLTHDRAEESNIYNAVHRTKTVKPVNE